MAQAAPPSTDKTKSPTAHSQLVPPDERFWQRYSPHAEFPLSSAGSLVIHVLLFGLLGLMAWLGAILFTHASQSLPIEAVRLDLGGGGGDPHGRGNGPNNGPAPVEAGGPTQEENVDNPSRKDSDPSKTLEIKPNPTPTLHFDPASTRIIQETNTEGARAFERLRDVTKKFRVPDSKQESGYGQGGKGSGGGSGDGQGTGVGDGTGAGRGKLTQREKRMLRWSMLFDTRSGDDYVAQLRGLGAILAVPVREDASGRDYRIVRDLGKRPARLLEEDISKIQRIYWIDDKAQSIRDVLMVLGIRLQQVPSHFVAFMPEDLEKKLYTLEKRYLEAHHPSKTEESIRATFFNIRVRKGKYEPEVSKLEMKN